MYFYTHLIAKWSFLIMSILLQLIPIITIVILILYSADMYDNLIGFITKAEDIGSKGIDNIEGYSRFGTLLKVHKSDISGYRISQNKKIYNLNLIGLTFAR